MKTAKSLLLFTKTTLCYHLNMTNKNKFVALIVLDFLTFLSMVIGITFSMMDVRFMVDLPRLSSLPILMTFTGLSNLFMGLVCLACALSRFIKKDITLSKPLFLLKIIALAEITITLVITATYLSPSLGSSWWRLYINNNIFNHLLTPFLAIVTFVIFEQYVEIDFKYLFFSLIPISAYGIFYIINVYTHLTTEGKTDLAYDIYGFARFGVFVLILFLIAFLGISFALTFLYRLLKKQKD